MFLNLQITIKDLKVYTEHYSRKVRQRLSLRESQLQLCLFWMMTSIITVRNEVAKVMFLHLSVILFTGESASVHVGIPHLPRKHTPREAHPSRLHTHPRKHPLWKSPPRDGCRCGWYASYWNAFLLIYRYTASKSKRLTHIHFQIPKIKQVNL